MSEKYVMTWEDFFGRLDKLRMTLSGLPKVYGVPKGGMILRLFCKFKAEHGDVSIDFLGKVTIYISSM